MRIDHLTTPVGATTTSTAVVEWDAVPPPDQDITVGLPSASFVVSVT